LAELIIILMMQVYMAISRHEEDEMEELYDIIEEILEEDGKGDTNTIVMEDWNSFVGDESYNNIVGPHGLGRKSHRCKMLINFCERNGLIVNNTWFRKPKGRQYTWKTQGDCNRHQLYYILLKNRSRDIVKCVQTLPGAYIDIDHNLLFVKICTRLKKVIRFQKIRPRWDLEKLYAERQRVQDTLEEKLGAIGCESGNVEVKGKNIKECVR